MTYSGLSMKDYFKLRELWLKVGNRIDHPSKKMPFPKEEEEIEGGRMKLTEPSEYSCLLIQVSSLS